MNKLFQKLANLDRDKLVRNSFLLPILLVVIISISHVTSWYDLGNPISWAMYLSIAIEVFALASVSAASIKINRGAVWFLFGLVTSIQIIGNVFFTYNDIDINSSFFKSWVELLQPLFQEWTSIDHKRLLALVQGGTLPIMSLTALHYYIKFGDKMQAKEDKIVDAIVEEAKQETTVAYENPGEKSEEKLEMTIPLHNKKLTREERLKELEKLISEYKEEVELKNDAPLPEPAIEEHEEPCDEDVTQEHTEDVQPIQNTTKTKDGKVQETFNFNEYLNDPKKTPKETMTSKINNQQ